MNNLIKYAKELNILYVEDNKDTRESTLLLLNTLFKNVIAAVDGKDGLEKFNNNSDINMIISDINMPIMDGLEMSENILKKDPTIPILIFSAHNEADFFLDAIKIGIEAYLLKPLDVDQFISVLGKVIEKIKLKDENSEYKKSLEQKVKKQVDQLRQKDKLLMQNSKMADMGEMLDIIAHQWKQPLNIIAMKSNLLYEFSQDGIDITTKDISDCANSIKYQINHLVNTLDEFRQFFRPTTHIDKVNLKEIIQSVQVLLHDNLIQNKIKLSLEIGDITFNANKNEFKHIFINLINNAKDAFIQNKIENRHIIIRSKQLDNKIIIEIQDNAGGIPKEIVEKIFKQNFTTKEESGGTGIGLYMCKTIASKYNTTLKVLSDDTGSTFILEIKA